MSVGVVAVLLFLLVVGAGCVIVPLVANKKWGYTEERERELEERSSGENYGRNSK
ncbi:MAG: hypothetical protein J1E62_07400 [Lachnospiraceae bacterium]|nr:hypothetical protein [Lachnospiraceae bacterium]